jgi:hypothetical protein
MESPFSKTKTVTMFLEPILHPFSKTYIDVITFSDMPLGPISSMVKLISPYKLSEFQMGYHRSCIFVLLRYPVSSGRIDGSCIENYMGVDDIPSVFSYLQSNGYIIEDGLTRMIQRGGFGISDSSFSGNRRTICMFSYYI